MLMLMLNLGVVVFNLSNLLFNFQEVCLNEVRYKYNSTREPMTIKDRGMAKASVPVICLQGHPLINVHEVRK
jgi:hypothetical protein